MANETGTYVVPLRDYLVPTETLRDKFAMVALVSLGSTLPSWADKNGGAIVYAECAYLLADAMMEERLRETKTDRGDVGGLTGSGVRVPLGDALGSTQGSQEHDPRRTWPANRRGSSEHD